MPYPRPLSGFGSKLTAAFRVGVAELGVSPPVDAFACTEKNQNALARFGMVVAARATKAIPSIRDLRFGVM
jgi:hypothetical protein